MRGNFQNQEKLVKRYLKRIIDLNEGTIVKYLITGSVALALTACGGGGGGSGSTGGGSSPTVPAPITKVENIKINGKDMEVSYKQHHDGTIDKNIVINGIKAEFVGDNSLIIRQELDSNGYDLKDTKITKENGSKDITAFAVGDIYTFEKNGNKVRLEIVGEGSFIITHENVKYEFSKGDEKAFASTDSKFGKIEYFVNKAGEIIDNKIEINGVLAQLKGENSLLILDKDATHNGYSLEGVTITFKDGEYIFEKEGTPSVAVSRNPEDGNYHISHNNNKYVVDSKGNLIYSDTMINPPSTEEGALPEIGVESDWGLVSSHEISFEKLQELIADGVVIHKDGKYYALDSENKHAYELVVDTTAAPDEDMPNVGIEKEWDLAEGIQGIDYTKFEEMLASGEIYEHDGKYYVVTDMENKIAQEVEKDYMMGSNPGEGELPSIGIEKEWDLVEGIQGIDYTKFEEMLASGEIYEHDGKYYVVTDMENKIAQEVEKDYMMGSNPGEGELPSIGIEKDWDLAEGIQGIDYTKFDEMLASGEIYEQDGKYYVVTDLANKVAQEVEKDYMMGSNPGEGDLPSIGIEKEWELLADANILNFGDFNALLASGALYEKNGKYYAVVNEKDKVAQEVKAESDLGNQEDSFLPEIGIEKEWELLADANILNFGDFNALLASGALYEKDGKYYAVVNEKDKVAQEVKAESDLGNQEDSFLPEIGIEKEWELLADANILNFGDFNALLASGALYEKDGKYYAVVNEKDKVAQEVKAESDLGNQEDSFLPEIGIEKEWELAERIQGIDYIQFNEMLALGEIYEHDGKYYVVTDSENKVAQEVEIVAKDKIQIVMIGNKEVEVKYTIGVDGSIKNEIELDGIKAEYAGNSLIIKDSVYINGHNLKDTTISKNDNIYTFSKEEKEIQVELLENNTLGGQYKIYYGGNEFITNDSKELLSIKDSNGEVLIRDLLIELENQSKFSSDSLNKYLFAEAKDIYSQGLADGLLKEANISNLQEYNYNYNNNILVSTNQNKNLFDEKINILDKYTSSSNLASDKSHTEIYQEISSKNTIKIGDKTYSILKNVSNSSIRQDGKENQIVVNMGKITSNGGQSTDRGIAINYGDIQTTAGDGQAYVVSNQILGKADLYNYGNIQAKRRGQYAEGFNSYIYNYGSIISENEGQYSPLGAVYNYGFIQSKQKDQRGKLTYNYGELISGGQSATDTAVNYGKISGEQYGAIFSYNYGTIISKSEYIVGQSGDKIYNYGIIDSLFHNGQNGKLIYNYGNLSGKRNGQLTYSSDLGGAAYNYGKISGFNYGQVATIANSEPGYLYNYGVIDVNLFGQYGRGEFTNYGTINIKSINTGNTKSYAQYSATSNGILTNYGKILQLAGTNSHIYGQYIDVGKNTVYNYGDIFLESLNSDSYSFIAGQYGQDGSTVSNYGNISIYSKFSLAYGQSASWGGELANYGNISVVSSYGKVIGQTTTGSNYSSSKIYNYGEIYIKSEGNDYNSEIFPGIKINGIGMYTAGLAINYGEIKIDNSSYESGATLGRYSVGMIAIGEKAEAYNYGTITTNAITGENITSENGESFDKVFMQGINGGKVYNYGILENTNASSTLSLGSGINSSSSAGYKSAGDFKLAGEMNIMSETGKGNSYVKENFITAGGTISGLENLTTEGVYEVSISEKKNEDGKNVVDLTLNKTKNIEDTVSGHLSKMIKQSNLDYFVYGEGQGADDFSELVNKFVSTGKTSNLTSIYGMEYANLNGSILDNSKRVSHTQLNLVDTEESFVEGNIGTNSDFKGIFAEKDMFGYKVGVSVERKDDVAKRVSGTIDYNRSSYLVIGSKALTGNSGVTLGYEYSENKYDTGSKLNTNSFGIGGYFTKPLSNGVNYTLVGDVNLGANTMKRGASETDFWSYSASVTNRLAKEIELPFFDSSEISGKLKTTLFGHEKINEKTADLSSGRDLFIDKKWNVSNLVNIGLDTEKDYPLSNTGTKLKFNLFGGYEKEIMNVKSWQDSVTLTGLSSADYATPVKYDRYGKAIGKLSVGIDFTNGLSTGISVSADSDGEKHAAFEAKYTF